MFILFLFLFTAYILFILTIHPFLSKDHRVTAEVLVFERWIYNNDNSVAEAINEFFKGNYNFIAIVGFIPENISPIELNSNSYIDEAKLAFIQNGFDKNLIHSIWVPNVHRHKTFSMALAFKMWLIESCTNVQAINVFTFGVHARKSELVFKQALEPEIAVGVVSAKPTHYNPKFWWLTKIGWKWVFYDSIKYLSALMV